VALAVGREALMSAIVREKVKAAKGIYRVHSRTCAASEGKRCNCEPTFQATVYSVRDDKLIRRHFPGQKEAELWRGEIRGAVADGKLRAAAPTSVKVAGTALLAGMRDGTITNRSGQRYKPSTVRRYELALEKHLEPVLGDVRLADVDRARVRALIRDWQRAGMVPSSIRNNLDPLRVLIREAIEDGHRSIDPLAGMKMPRGQGRRERVADRAEAQLLLQALPDSERALWACAFYAGLRRGELQGLRVEDIDLSAGAIHVRRGWDQYEGAQATKTEAGERVVPLADALKRLLREHLLLTGRRAEQLVFGRSPTEPFIASTVRARALKAWRTAGLKSITLHEARHSTASYLVEAGLNDLELAGMIGHSDPRTTKTIYAHLFEDSREKARAKLDAYLAGG
jgi:integrase